MPRRAKPNKSPDHNEWIVKSTTIRHTLLGKFVDVLQETSAFEKEVFPRDSKKRNHDNKFHCITDR